MKSKEARSWLSVLVVVQAVLLFVSILILLKAGPSGRRRPSAHADRPFIGELLLHLLAHAIFAAFLFVAFGTARA